MLTNFSWVVLIFILLILKKGILEPLEDKKKYKKRKELDKG